MTRVEVIGGLLWTDNPQAFAREFDLPIRPTGSGKLQRVSPTIAELGVERWKPTDTGKAVR